MENCNLDARERLEYIWKKGVKLALTRTHTVDLDDEWLNRNGYCSVLAVAERRLL